MIYGLTIFLSAFLLFQVQLISAKRLLPWFGGAPAVWTTCEVFFQVALLAGYAYAHWLTRSCRPKRQFSVHMALLLAAAAALAGSALWGGVPLLAPAALKPTGIGQPIPLLLAALLATVGLPFFVLSATGPLLQSWHSRSSAPLDHTYRLYALSNAGSLAGLVSYPFAVESLFGLSAQAWGWTALFLIFAAVCGVVSWRSRSFPIIPAPSEAHDETATGRAGAGGRGVVWFWLLLSFTSSALFLATTNQLCQQVAVVPFLWVLPLAIYLLTFIVCFDRPQWYSRGWCVAGAMALGIAVLLRPPEVTIPISWQVAGYGAFLGFFCMACHGELVRLRPGAAKLTQFYLVIAAGGAAGGAFVSLAAPFLFSGLWELYIAVLLGWILFGLLWLNDRGSPLWTGGRPFFALSALLASLVAAPYVLVLTPLRRAAWVVQHPWQSVMAGAVVFAALVCAAAWRRPLARRPLWARGLLLLLAGLSAGMFLRRMGETRTNTVFAGRNFFGLVRVVAVKDQLSETGAYKLIHGVTNHGMQFTDPRWRDFPTTYYSPSSGIGYAARAAAARAGGGGLRIGVLGLGVGTIAAYARPGDSVRFYEIDPIVIALAGDGSPYFTFLRDCAGEVSVVAGDARLSLERELSAGTPGRFDLLALDAFSGDAIPVHLLTEEAFRLYLSHLRGPRSILAVHITNAYLDLEPVIAANASALGLDAVRIDSSGADSQLPEPSTWILLSRDPGAFRGPDFAAASPRPLKERRTLFTDQYSNLFRVVR